MMIVQLIDRASQARGGVSVIAHRTLNGSVYSINARHVTR